MGSGLRIGELVALRWRNVDLDGGVVRVVDFTTYVGHDIASSPGKSKDAVRSIDVDANLVRVLKAQRAIQAKERLAATTYIKSDFVFTMPSGGPCHPQYLSKLLSRTTEELGLPRLSAHGLRHTSATLMLASGIPPKVAAERLGHSDPSLFLNLYSHVTPTMQRDAAEKIGQALFGPG
jgi:integrase